MGRRHRSFFRLNAIDGRAPRDGKVIEPLGWYDPCSQDPDKQASLNAERILYWLSVGAQPSETVANLLKRHGIEKGKPAPQPEPEPGATAASTAEATAE